MAREIASDDRHPFRLDAVLVGRIDDAELPQRAVEDTLKALADQAHAAAFSGQEITLPGIGKLGVTHRAARTGRNPQTGAEIQIPAKRAPAFTPAKAIKDACNA